MFGPLAKWVAQIDEVERIPELIARAFHTATSGRPGPVVLALPEDMLVEEADVPDAAPYEPTRTYPGDADLERMRALLQGAARPLVIVGGQPWTAQAHDDLAAWCEAGELPIAASFRCQDYVDNDSPVYAGHLTLGQDPRLGERVRDADVLLVVGDRLSEITTSGYTLLEVPRPQQALIHVHPDPDELGRVYQPELAIAAGAGGARRRAWPRAAARRLGVAGGDGAGAGRVLREPPPDAAARRARHGRGDRAPAGAPARRTRSSRTAPATSRSGHIASTSSTPTRASSRRRAARWATASLRRSPRSSSTPSATVVAFAGDGDFLMTGQELATAVQYDAAIVVLVVDNAMLGTIRMHQERHYPGRVSGTDLVNPDFAALALAYGAFGEKVTRTAEFPAALERALAAGRPALLHLVVDPEALTPRQTLTEIREQARAKS